MALSTQGRLCAVRLCRYISVGSILLLAASAFAQTTTQTTQPKIPRDDAAVAAINKSLTAMGGVAAFTALKDTKTLASCTRVSKSKSETHSVRWITAGEYFRYDGGENDHRGIVNGPGGAGRVTDGKPVPLNDRSVSASKPIHFPGLLLFKGLARPEDAIEMLKPEDIQGVSAVHVRITDTKASQNTTEIQQEDWFFDPNTGLPIKLKFSAPAPNSLFLHIRTTVEWSNYTSMSSFVLPTTMRRTFEGGPPTTCTVSEFSANNNPDSSIFLTSTGGGK